ncbi:FMN-dependent NADH-azoreductase [Aquibacillus rhizosphaerae]|uniref:FMN dependent NADH:quinone oxidoreductase n=1 Tax=Aquibacillus rhizosphaerae TaxID=3051431 RepID=A0ABT7LCJ2_9BACI|nr:NAD(P)H-dependent oxidoreductase [Aquibacillus sp. LR5S19]MDL4842977.1 NAD(P)H-dependent oxidoreductase [Aquibacillus sp. LR5S19]
MPKLLYITANPKKEVQSSKGAQIGEVFLETFKKERPEVEIDRLHLYDMNITRIDQDLLYARVKLAFQGYSLDEVSDAEREKFTAMQAHAEHFINADYYVFVTPLWNLGAPGILKDYMDNMFQFKKTFTRNEEGVQGLLTDRTAIHIQTRGGIYSTGPMVDFEMGDRYLTKALTFLGMDVMNPVIAEGMDHFPKQIPEIIEKAKQDAVKAAKDMAKHKISS